MALRWGLTHTRTAADPGGVAFLQFGAQAIAGRLDDLAARSIALQHCDMASATVTAWQQWSRRGT